MKYRLYGDKFSPFPGNCVPSEIWMDKDTADSFIYYCIARTALVNELPDGNIAIQYNGNTLILMTEENDREHQSGQTL